MTSTDTARRPALLLLVPPVAAAVVAMAVSSVVPLLSALLVALVIGAIVTNSPVGRHAVIRDQGEITKIMLRIGVVLIGLKLPLDELVEIGGSGIVVILGTVVVTYTLTVLIGGWLGLDTSLVRLVAAGFSICGASAIVAVETAVRARQRDVALAVAMVTVYGSAMIVAVPAVGSALGLHDMQIALWAGASIHEVAQVVAAASIVGSAAVVTATTIKLGRVALLAPVYVISARGTGNRSDRGTAVLPWFVVGFLLAAVVRTTGILPAAVLDGADHVTTLLLAAAMFGLGVGIRARELWPVPVRVLMLGAASTAVAASTSLLLVVTVA